MKQHEMRINIPTDLYKRYKIVCVEKDLSVPKQTAFLLLSFVETQEENKRRIDESKKYNQQRNKNG